MAISICTVTVNSKGEELQKHGTFPFPIAYYEENLSEASIPWHWHEDIEMIWVTSGSIKVLINTTEHIVNKNQGIFINAGLLHAVQSNANEECVLQSVVFHPRLIGSIDSVYWQNYVEPVIQNKNLPFFSWKHQFPGKMRLSGAPDPHGRNHSLCEATPTTRNIRNADRIKAMLQFIQNHFTEEITIADLAREALISESEVLRCFHNTIYITPNQYVKQYRIQRAVRMLADTDLTSLEIALECGFQNSSYFTKTFKAQMGITPICYRKSRNSRA